MNNKKHLLICKLILPVFFIFNLILFTKADSAFSQRLFDDAGFFDNDEFNQINSLLLDTEAKTGFFVSLVTTFDVGSNKSDAGVQDWADLYYEKYFGLNTDGLIFVINNDTKYDYISTSGICEEYFNTPRIDNIFDSVWDSLVSDEYSEVVETYCERVLYYYNQGIPNYNNKNNTGNSYQEQNGNSYIEYKSSNLSPEESLLIGVSAGFLISVIIAVLIVFAVKSRYRIKPVKNAFDYLNRSSVKYYQKSDTFIRRFITKRKIETNNNSGGGSKGGHFSSGGGHHGGGGRHR